MTIHVLKASIKQNRYGSAYLFSGPPGVGKTTLGRIFSNAVLCDSSVDSNPCGKCETCLLFAKEQHFSYRELDAASYGGKEDMVKLRDNASSLAATKKKIILLDESQDISKQGQDALLEQTEECPEHLIYIFCTTEPNKMKDTLRERCMEFHITKVDPSLIAQRLKTICEKEDLSFQDDAIQVIAERSDGHVRSAVNLLEEIAYLGEISLENLNKISKDFEKEIFTIISNLGIDLTRVIEVYQSISSYLSSFEFYNLFLSFVNDAAKLLYGYDNFSEKRKNLLLKLNKIHGFSLIEFLNYLILRDKFVNKTGLQSDLVILHYKFNANNFVPRNQKEPSIDPQSQSTPKSDSPSPPVLRYAELSKMSIKDRSKVLREQRKNQKVEVKEESEIVPSKWPLSKEERPRKDPEEDLTPQEFSQKLVGGRGGEVRSMVDTRTE